MKSRRILTLVSTILLTLVFALPALAQKPPRLSKLTTVDIHYMTSQRALIEDLSRSNFGSGFTGTKGHDLKLLQRILDLKLVKPRQTAELQAMGIIMGDLLATDLGLHWVIYQDGAGRSRALQFRQKDEFLFPVTMISRRREVDNHQSISDIYQKAYEIMQASKPPSRFE